MEDVFGEEAEGMPTPVHADLETDRRFEDFWASQDPIEPIEPDAYANSVLHKIVHEGFIKSGWSFRKGRATVYGPKSAVCFTEMPLSSLVAYAKKRGKNHTVKAYAIGLLKSELFAAGGRPTIYGLTGKHEEADQALWPRYLADEYGIGESEQYRYVALNLDATRRIDWTHEREWRWADHHNAVSVPGLPVWRVGEPVAFTRAIIVVQSEVEVRELLDLLRRMIDTGPYGSDVCYNLSLLQATAVISIDELEEAKLLKATAALTLEQIPHQFLQYTPNISASEDQKRLVGATIAEALRAAEAAAAEWRKGGDRDVCGSAQLIIEDATSEFVRAALELKLVEPFGGIHPFGPGGYWLMGIGKFCKMQGLGESEAAVEAARGVILRHFPELFIRVHTCWD